MSIDLAKDIWEPEPEINGYQLRPYDFPSKEKHGKVISWLSEEDNLNEMELAKAFLYIHAAPISDLCRNIRNKERFFIASEEFFLKFPKKEHMEEFCHWFAKCRELEEAAVVETVARPSFGKEETPPPN